MGAHQLRTALSVLLFSAGMAAQSDRIAVTAVASAPVLTTGSIIVRGALASEQPSAKRAISWLNKKLPAVQEKLAALAATDSERLRVSESAPTMNPVAKEESEGLVRGVVLRQGAVAIARIGSGNRKPGGAFQIQISANFEVRITVAGLSASEREGAISRVLDAMRASGLRVDKPTLLRETSLEAEHEEAAIKKAIVLAREQAQAALRVSGGTLGRILSLEAAVTPRSDDRDVEVQQEIEVRLNVTFAVE